MGREKILLTESQLCGLVQKSIKKILKEMDLTSAAFPDSMLKYTNYKIDDGDDAGADMNGAKVSEFDRNGEARKLRNQTLAHYLLQEVGGIQFVFRVYDDKVGDNVAASFTMSSVTSYNDKSISFGGILRKSSNNQIEEKPAIIEYVFESGDFFYNTYINRNKRNVKLLFPTKGNAATSNSVILSAVLECLRIYKIESEKLFSELRQNGCTKQYSAILHQRLASQSKK